jgi:hypothetical protein
VAVSEQDTTWLATFYLSEVEMVMDGTNSNPPFFSAIEPRAWTSNRLYRVYVQAGELVCVWAGSGNDLAIVLAAQGGLIGGLLSAAASPARKNASRSEELASKSFEELRDDHQHNFTLCVEEIDDAVIVPVSFWFRMNYSGVHALALLKIRTTQGRRLTLALTTKEDVGQALELLPAQLRARLRVEIPVPPAGVVQAPPSRLPGRTEIAVTKEMSREHPPAVPVTPPSRSALPAVIVAVVVVLLVGIVGVALAWHYYPAALQPDRGGPRNPSNEPRVQVPVEAWEIPKALWRPFSSVEGRFQVIFPGPTRLEEKEIAFKVGRVKRFAYSCGFTNPNVSFWADYMDLTPEVARQCPPEQSFDYLQGRMLNQLREGQVVSSRPAPLGVHPGRECLLAGGGTEVAARIYAVPVGENIRLFLLMVRGVDVRPNSRDVGRFFDSFSYREP